MAALYRDLTHIIVIEMYNCTVGTVIIEQLAIWRSLSVLHMLEDWGGVVRQESLAAVSRSDLQNFPICIDLFYMCFTFLICEVRSLVVIVLAIVCRHDNIALSLWRQWPCCDVSSELHPNLVVKAALFPHFPPPPIPLLKLWHMLSFGCKSLLYGASSKVVNKLDFTHAHASCDHNGFNSSSFSSLTKPPAASPFPIARWPSSPPRSFLWRQPPVPAIH